MATTEGSGRKRTVEIRVKLSPGIAESFAAIAEVRGILPATLAAVVIGEYIEKKVENTVLQNKVAMHGASLMASSFTPEKISALLTEPGFMDAIASSVAKTEGTVEQAGSSAVPEAAARPSGSAQPNAGRDRVRNAT